MIRPTSGVILQAGDPSKIEEDKNEVQDYVKEVLLEKVVFIWNKVALQLGGVLHNDYLMNCRAKIAGGKLMNPMERQWGRNIHELVVDNDDPTKEQAKATAEEVRKDALANVSNWHHMQSYKKVKSMLIANTLTTTMPEMTSQSAAKEFTKKKRWKSMMELKKYTGSASKKQKGTVTSSRVGPRESGRNCTRKYVMPSISLTRLTKAAHLVMTKWIT